MEKKMVGTLVRLAEQGRNIGTPPLIISVEDGSADDVAQELKEKYMVWGEVETIGSDVVCVNSVLEKQLSQLAEKDAVERIELDSVFQVC